MRQWVVGDIFNYQRPRLKSFLLAGMPSFIDFRLLLKSDINAPVTMPGLNSESMDQRPIR